MTSITFQATRPLWQRIAVLFCLGMFAQAPGRVLAQTPSGGPLQLGGNVNERPQWLTPEVLAQTHTTWVRAFVPASDFISGARSYETDPGLQTLRAAARSGHKVILSIKWDCADNGPAGRVPAPGSKEEQTWFKFADDLVAAMGKSLSILAVNNELFIDTAKPDLQPDASGEVPMVRFLKRLVDHLSAGHPQGVDGKPLPLYAGGFTRLDLAKTRAEPALKPMLDWLGRDPHVAGVDFHLHEPDIAASKTALEFIRHQVPGKPFIVTEFSLIVKWKKHLLDRVDAVPSGAAFARKYALPPASTVLDFFNRAFEHPVPVEEWRAFLASQPWFEPNYLDEVGPLMQANGVIVATYALTLNPLRGSKPKEFRVTEETNPWFVNDLLVPGLAVSANPNLGPENYGFYESFVRWQSKHEKP